MEELEPFLAKLAETLNERGLENVEAAFRFGAYGHLDKPRHNGDHGFEHPLAVAVSIIEELELKDDWRIHVATLLHDIREDSKMFSQYRIQRNFGRTVANWVKLLTKDPKEGYLERLKSAPWQVLVIKLCDRLHNLRTLEHCAEAMQRKQVLETYELYLPLADLLIARLPAKIRRRGENLKEKIADICVYYESRLGL